MSSLEGGLSFFAQPDLTIFINIMVMLKGKFEKKMLLNKKIRLNNRLASKFCNFFTIVPKIDTFIIAKTYKNDNYYSKNKTILNKDCEIWLNTVLFLEKMNKIEDNKAILYKIAFSTSNLLLAYNQERKTIKKVNLKWFWVFSNKLLKGKFIYPKVRRVSIFKKLESTSIKSLVLISLWTKVLERAVLTVLEPLFEGKFKWKSVSKLEYNFIKKNNNDTVIVKNKSGYFTKSWMNFPIFSWFSFGYRLFRSAHGALNLIKEWPTNLNWFIKFDTVKKFDIVNQNRLKNIFFKYCFDRRIWNEINKLLKAKVVDLRTTSTLLSPFLFNVYMIELDNFIESLKLKYNNTGSIFSKNLSIETKYKQIFNKFKTKRGLANILSEYGSPDLVLALYKKEKTAFFKTYKFINSKNKTFFWIKYVRYVNDFILGIIGPRDFASKIAIAIENFIKSNLRFQIYNVIIKNCNSGAVKFLGFNIQLCPTINKTKIKPNKVIYTVKKRLLARFKGNDAWISQAYFNSIKHGFLNYLKYMYEKFNIKKNKNIDMVFIKNFIIKSLEEFFLINFQNESSFQNANLALKRFVQVWCLKILIVAFLSYIWF